jgi:hypothetical protein
MRCICLGKPKKSTVAEHRFEAGHNIDFSSISILGKAGYMDHILKEAIEIKLQPSNFKELCMWDSLDT